MSKDRVGKLLEGRAQAAGLRVHLSDRDGAELHAKMRQAYWWIVNNAVLCPYYDVEFGRGARFETATGDVLTLNDDASYSSFVLLPLLTLFTSRRALLVGGPGRGKTTSAVLMALLSGMTKDAVHRSIQRGHPQLTITDLLGAPMPSELMKAEDAADVKVAWRTWISQRVKIVDEYNRIPTKTQSALLSLMGDGYAEMFDQYVYAGRSAWFLTANDDQGGGTFQVIEALKDRIDVVVRAIPFNSGFLEPLLARIEADRNPEDLVPREIVFTPEELERVHEAILAVRIPEDVLARVAFFLGQLDFCRRASPQFEYMNKDTLKLARQSVGSVCNEQCPLDKKSHLCTQTENGVSVRGWQTALHYSKALAYFRGHGEVELEDVRQLVPWVLHDKLVPNARSAYFEPEERRVLLADRVAWIRTMFDTSLRQYERHAVVRSAVRAERLELDRGLGGVTLAEAEVRMGRITAQIGGLMKEQELSGFVYEDLILLKALHSRYRNYAQWLKQEGR